MADKEVENYISLHKATEYCDYSHEYLRLRARTGKLRAIKLGRNWLTKKEWIQEYLIHVSEYKKSLERKKITEEYIPEEVKPFSKASFIVLISTALVLLTIGFVFGRSFLTEAVDTLVYGFSEIGSDYYLASVAKDFREYFQWLATLLLKIKF